MADTHLEAVAEAIKAESARQMDCERGDEVHDHWRDLARAAVEAHLKALGLPGLTDMEALVLRDLLVYLRNQAAEVGTQPATEGQEGQT